MRDRIHARILRMKKDLWLWSLVGIGLCVWLLGEYFPATRVPVGLVFSVIICDHAHYIFRRRHRGLPVAKARR